MAMNHQPNGRQVGEHEAICTGERERRANWGDHGFSTISKTTVPLMRMLEQAVSSLPGAGPHPGNGQGG